MSDLAAVLRLGDLEGGSLIVLFTGPLLGKPELVLEDTRL